MHKAHCSASLRAICDGPHGFLDAQDDGSGQLQHRRRLAEAQCQPHSGTSSARGLRGRLLRGRLRARLHSNAPDQPGLNIDGKSAWKRSSQAGALVGPATVTSQQSGNTLLDKLNDAIPNTGSGTVDIPVELTSESAGKLSIVSFEITYTMQTTNLDMTIPEGEILHERITPYEVVSRHVIGEAANSMVSAELHGTSASSALQ